MEISFYTAWIIQLLFNIGVILVLFYIGYLILSLIHRVRNDKKGEIDKKKEITKILIYSLIAIVLFCTINLFLTLDPFNIIEEPLGDRIQEIMNMEE